jgi:hypothetical protein
MASTLLVTGQDSVADFGGGSFSVGSAGTPSNDTGYVQVLGGGQLDTGGTTLSGGLTKTGYVSGVGSDWMTNDLTIQNSADVLADQGGSLIVSGNAAVQSNSTLRADGGTINVSGNLNLGTDSVAASDLSLQNSSTLAVTGFIQSGNLVSPQNSITLASSNVSASQLNLDNTTMTLINASSLTVYHAALLQSKLTVDATSNIVRLLGLGVGQRSVLNLSAGSSMTVSQSVELSGGTINLGNAGLLTIGSGTLNGPPHQLTIFPNGVLSGVGTIIGSTFNGGVVHVGDDPGTMTIEGNYQQVPGSTLAIEVGPSSTSLLVTTGAATIQGGTLSLIPVSGAMINLGQTYTVLTAAGGVTGAFTTVDTSSPFITLSPALTGDKPGGGGACARPGGHSRFAA